MNLGFQSLKGHFMDALKNKGRLLPILLILALAMLLLVKLYSIGGIYWDLVTRFLFSRSLLAPQLYGAILNHDAAIAVSHADSFYLEPFREPLLSVLALPFVMSQSGGYIIAFLLFEMLLLFWASWYLSRQAEISPMLLTLLLFTPYLVYFLMVLDGSEVLSMVFLLFMAAFMLKKSAKAGIFVGLASLTKYVSLIFVPVLLLLPKGDRKRAAAYLILTTLPWLMFNWMAFGNPLYSYGYSLELILTNSASYTAPNPSGAILTSLNMIFSNLIPPIAIIALALLFYALGSGNGSKLLRRIREFRFSKLGYRYRLSLYLVFLAAIGWAFLSSSNSINNLPRWGYILYFSIATLLAILLNDLFSPRAKGVTLARYRTLAYLALFSISAATLLYSLNAIGRSFPLYSYGTTNATILEAVGTIKSAGLSNCSVVSNDWVYLRFYGIKAHSPYYYNRTILGYPIVSFDGIGVQPSVINTSYVERTVRYTGFSIYFPANYSCA